MEIALNAYQMILFISALIVLIVLGTMLWKGHVKTGATIAAVWFVFVVFMPVKTVAPSHGDREAPASFDKAFTAPVPPADTRSLKQQNEDEYEALKAQSKELENEINR